MYRDVQVHDSATVQTMESWGGFRLPGHEAEFIYRLALPDTGSDNGPGGSSELRNPSTSRKIKKMRATSANRLPAMISGRFALFTALNLRALRSCRTSKYRIRWHYR